MYKKIDTGVHLIHEENMVLKNYDLPQKTLKKVQAISGAKSKEEAIIIALNEYIKNKKREGE